MINQKLVNLYAHTLTLLIVYCGAIAFTALVAGQIYNIVWGLSRWIRRRK